MSKRRRSKKSKTSTTPVQSEQLCMKLTDIDAAISSNIVNHFGYAPFPLKITLSPPLSKNKAFTRQPLSVQLVFEDGKQIDTVNKNNPIKFTTIPQSLFISKTSECNLSVQIDTYSIYNDNQAFKLVFKLSENATRHIRPCESKAFLLVKNRLEIHKALEDTFYKDEGGRSNFLRCQILLKDSKKKTVTNRDIALQSTLLYEDMSVVESSHDILELLTTNTQLKQGQCFADFRINEVSKNHNRRAFRVLFECKSSDALYNDISSCVTNPILVKSKRTKKTKKAPVKRETKPKKRKSKRKRKQTRQKSPSYDESDMELTESETDEPLCKKQRSNGSVFSQVAEWCKFAEKVISKLEWTACGYEYDEATNSIDHKRPIYKCSYCLKYRDSNGWGEHHDWCQLKLALTHYNTKFKGNNNSAKYQNISVIPRGGGRQLPPTVTLTTPNVMSGPMNGGNGGMGVWPFGPNPPPPIHAQVSNNMRPVPFGGYQSIGINAMGSKGKGVQVSAMGNGNGNVSGQAQSPMFMSKIAGVSRVRSKHGYDAFDEGNNFVGSFNDNGEFCDVSSLNVNQNNQYSPIFNPNQMLLRNQSSDSFFYDSIRNNIFDNKW